MKKEISDVEKKKKSSMGKEERALMLKIAKEVEAIEKRPWFKRLDEEDRHIALGKMTEPETPEQAQPGSVIRATSAPKTSPEDPLCVITTTFTARDVEHIKENQIVQSELRAQIIKVCKEHGIVEMQVHYKETPRDGGAPVPAPQQMQP